MARTFEQFTQGVRDSVEKHAQRKNYCSDGVDGPNQLLDFLVSLGIHDGHAAGEVIYKMVEYLKAPPAVRKVILEKVAGWCWTMWRELP